MSKRRDDGDTMTYPSPKRRRISQNSDYLSFLSDEVLLCILSYLPIPALLKCQRVSRRFHTLAGDSELWKRQYYSRWVRPRARRLARVRRATPQLSRLEYSPKVSTWLDHSHLAREGSNTNWKKQYRLRHNWSKGICRVTAVELPQSPKPPILVQFCAGLVFVADSAHGLRVWHADNTNSCLASVPFTNVTTQALIVPTSLKATYCSQQNMARIAVGFKSGCFRVYNMDIRALRLKLGLTYTSSTDRAITGMALSFPYILIVSQCSVLSLFGIQTVNENSGHNPVELMEKAYLLATLKAESMLAPMSLSVRVAGSEIIASIAYSFYHIGCGWSIGIQELHFNRGGQQISSRLTTTVDCQYGVIPLRPSSRAPDDQQPSLSSDLYGWPTGPSILHRQPPTSISYSHPYLLTSHADNTLTVYLVVSTTTNLHVKGGQRLWGHTTSVAAVQVSDHGKAVSVSSRGDEIRIWELEPLISYFGTQRILDEKSIQVSPDSKQCRKYENFGVLSGLSRCEVNEDQSSSPKGSYELDRIRGCIGFDDERVLLLRERNIGNQLLEFYDFT
ncbi:hypothetical protein BDV38DRAFT_256633 [Aspergillus pseudotamarii]|uniref:Probable E3 ubiquitin ligase complex SCF subunit sconB n=1 Tax=Aspergillus pseudotamarii TaxID=132259 RepID=A0A5N6SLQ6_ASPPS|nr:uncharacterized protein BDV38DRAFT_256633 [Aspergillus pseudotamarii]KAE8134074.1 hypothetical protein BDV38DRAFT_256633 [Aspergillus pseudotamarii]